MAVSTVREEHVFKVKEYAERVNLRRLMYIQRELVDKRKWLAGYDADPNPYLVDAAERMRETIKSLEREEDMQFSRLTEDTQRMLNRL